MKPPTLGSAFGRESEGYYSPDAQNYYGFTGDASKSNISVSGGDFPCNLGITDPSGINNNGQIVGYSYGKLDSQYNSLSSFLVNGGACNAGFADQYGWTYGLNDDVQIVGETFGLSSSPFSGFVLTPQHWIVRDERNFRSIFFEC